MVPIRGQMMIKDDDVTLLTETDQVLFNQRPLPRAQVAEYDKIGMIVLPGKRIWYLLFN